MDVSVICTWRIYFASDFDEVFENEFLMKIQKYAYIYIYIEGRTKI